MIANGSTITILCAGPGLGFYVPGIMMQRQLKRLNIPAQTYVFEEWLIDDKKNNVRKTKENFHRDFSFALMGQKLAKSPSTSIDFNKLSALFNSWKKENRNKFVVFSGFWMPIIERYTSEVDNNISVDLCHLDADYSSSWNLFNGTSSIYNEIWFNRWKKKEINYHFNIAIEEPEKWDDREEKFIIHGGGWGIGTYNELIRDLNSNNFSLDVIAYENADLENISNNNKYFLMNPNWNTWDTNESGEHYFPPLQQMGNGNINIENPLLEQGNDLYPSIYNLIRKSKAIISKPGAGTLLDSIASATPIVFLKPFGEYENKNSLLWKHFKLGISYEEWAENDFSEEILSELHNNILKVRDSTTDYTDFYLKKHIYGI